MNAVRHVLPGLTHGTLTCPGDRQCQLRIHSPYACSPTPDAVHEIPRSSVSLSSFIFLPSEIGRGGLRDRK